MKKVLNQLIFIVFIGLVSCKKEKLEGNSSILVGAWTWSSTKATFLTCNPPTYVEIITPQTVGIDYGLNFSKKGLVEFETNEEILSEARIVDLLFNEIQGSTTEYLYNFTLIWESKGATDKLTGLVGNDTLLIKEDYPYPDSDCENYSSYFVRQ